ncbi:MAG: OmpA family protein [Hyphomicrobiaceae bacterium]|nr:OmpA family protein [Hyphomicrobiaceae bacterium]
MTNLTRSIGLAGLIFLSSAAVAFAQDGGDNLRRQIRQAYSDYADALLALQQNQDPAAVDGLAGDLRDKRSIVADLCQTAGYNRLKPCFDERVADNRRVEGDTQKLDDILAAASAALAVPAAVEEPPAMVEEPSQEPDQNSDVATEPEEVPAADAGTDAVQPETPVVEADAPAETEVIVEADGTDEAPVIEEQPQHEEPQATTTEPASDEAASETMPEPPADAVEPETPVNIGADAVVEEVVEGAAPDEVAPVLDSLKDQASTPVAVEDNAGPAGQAAEPLPVIEVAPPQSDADAQSEEVKETVVVSADQEQGRQVNQEQAAEERQRQINTAPPVARKVNQPQNGNAPLDLRAVFEIGNQLIIRNRDDDRLQAGGAQTVQEDLGGGQTRNTVFRPDGTRVVTIFNRNGDIVQRSRFDADGREHIIVFTPENRREDLLEWRDPAEDLPPLRLNIPVSEYVLDVSHSNPEQVVQFLDQPPVEQIQRLYSVDEVKRSARIRDTVRRLEISDLTFETGSANLGPQELGSLAAVAEAMKQMLAQNPGELFLIEGHTDAVGDEYYNLRLSDLRAETVAVALSQLFGVPPENLTTQGYGERYLKVRTQAAERANRRVTIKRITPLVSPVGIVNG